LKLSSVDFIVCLLLEIVYNKTNIKFSLDIKDRKGNIMNLAKISSNGQITIPVEIRRLLGLKSGDKILFFQKQNGEVVVSNASMQSIYKAQTAFSGAAEEMGVCNEEDVQALVDEIRHGKEM
jgi:AbrB family looped-hinge helix DNA binding protein